MIPIAIKNRDGNGSAGIVAVHWIVQTIGEHIIAQNALAGGCEGIGIDEAAEFGIVIAVLEVIEFGFLVVDIATVAQGVELPEGGCCGTGISITTHTAWRERPFW